MNTISKVLLVVLSIASTFIYAQVQDKDRDNNPPKNICVNDAEIVFGFFNGVMTDEKEAIAKIEKLKKL